MDSSQESQTSKTTETEQDVDIHRAELENPPVEKPVEPKPEPKPKPKKPDPAQGSLL